MKFDIKEFLKRVGKAKGFGIQSPWAFRFVTEVVAERWRYYAYEDIEKQFPKRYEQKYQKLLFRIRNFVYPDKLLVMPLDSITAENLQDLPRQVGKKGAIVVEGLRESKESLSKWEKLKAREEIGVTFDMYSFAVCFFDRNIYKQHYKLNFM